LVSELPSATTEAGKVVVPEYALPRADAPRAAAPIVIPRFSRVSRSTSQPGWRRLYLRRRLLPDFQQQP